MGKMILNLFMTITLASPSAGACVWLLRPNRVIEGTIKTINYNALKILTSKNDEIWLEVNDRTRFKNGYSLNRFHQDDWVKIEYEEKDDQKMNALTIRGC